MKQTVAHYCASIFKNNYVKQLEKLCIFDSPLIDIKIMHSILSSPDKSMIIVAAGGSHIEKMNEFLASMGYKKIIVPKSFYHHTNIDTTVSARNKKDMHARPPAVNLKVLDEIVLSRSP